MEGEYSVSYYYESVKPVEAVSKSIVSLTDYSFLAYISLDVTNLTIFFSRKIPCTTSRNIRTGRKIMVGGAGLMVECLCSTHRASLSAPG